jgi:hypothetical protein
MPLAAAEIFGAKHRWLAELLAAGEPTNFRTTLERSDIFNVVAAGGYPAALRRATLAQRTRWFASYLATVTDRDLPDPRERRRRRHPSQPCGDVRWLGAATSDDPSCGPIDRRCRRPWTAPAEHACQQAGGANGERDRGQR